MSDNNDASRWFLRPQNSNNAKLRLFCFPYAGGSPHIFSPWSKLLPSDIELCPVLMPGRGSRISEEPIREISRAVSVLADKIADLSDLPFAFFGHSLGATIAFELVNYLEKEKGISPVYLFVSGRSAPQTLQKSAKTYHLSDEEFVESVKQLGGTPQGLLENQELLELILPTLKADFQMVQNYSYTPDEPIKCPVFAFGGTADNFIARENIEAWGDLTEKEFAACFLEGDHFFVNRQGKAITEIIVEKLLAERLSARV